MRGPGLPCVCVRDPCLFFRFLALLCPALCQLAWMWWLAPYSLLPLYSDAYGFFEYSFGLVTQYGGFP